MLTPGTIYRGGQVLVDDTGNIACVGCNCDQSATDATRISCPEGVVSPGLINPHDHITYAQDPPYTDTGERYEQRHDWRKGLRGHTKISARGGANAEPDPLGRAALRARRRDVDGRLGRRSDGLLRNLDRRTSRKASASRRCDYDTFPLGDSQRHAARSAAAPIRRSSRRHRCRADDSYVPHVAEGIDAVARNEFLCLSSTLNGGQRILLVRRRAFIHGVGLTPPDYARHGSAGHER